MLDTLEQSWTGAGVLDTLEQEETGAGVLDTLEQEELEPGSVFLVNLSWTLGCWLGI